MSLIGPRTLADWIEVESTNMHPTLEGGAELLRDNLAPNQRFIDIDEFGDAEGYPVELPPEAASTTGFHFYASAVGKHSLRKQTGVPRPLGTSGWDMTEPYLPEGTMPVGNPKIAAFGNYRPPAPLVVSVAGGKAGYVAGTRQLFITRVSRSGRHSLPSEGASFTLTSGQGFVATLPDSISGGPRIGWWLTAPGGGRDTARLQKITLASTRKVPFAGSYSGGRRMPSRNETELAAPPRMRYGKQGMVYRGPAPGALHPGDYRFTWAKRTAFGVSRAAPWSGVESVAGVAGTDEQGNPITLPEPGTAFIIRKPRKERDMVGWALYVQINGTSYRVQGTGSLGDEGSYLGFGPLPVRIYGDTSQEGGRTNLVLSQEQPPLENTSGIEAPSGAPEEIAPFQASTSLAATGTRRYAYAEVVEDGRGGEKVSLHSDAVRHTTAAGEYARVIPPDPANIFSNAEGRERGSDGVPLNMTVGNTASGSYSYLEGKHQISTNGAAYSSATIHLLFDPREVNTSQTYCFRGMLEAEIVAGEARLSLSQYDATGAAVGSPTALSTLASSGARPFEVRVGPEGDIPWVANTVSVALFFHMTGTTRNMTARAYHLGGHPYPMAPRKVTRGAAYETADFDPSPERPFPRGVVTAVGPAPVTSGTVDSTPPLAELDFTESATLAEPGWTHTAPGIISQIETIAGQRVWRIDDQTQDQIRVGYLSYTATAADSLAARLEEKVVKLPGGPGNHTEKLRLQGGAGYYLGSVRFFSQNGVRIEAHDSNGKKIDSGPITHVFEGDELDYELIASKVGTSDGTLTLLYGRNGEQRRVVGSISSIDWRNRNVAEVRGGVPREDNPNTRWQYYVKRITVTRSGAPVGEAANPPAGESAVPPDRPTRSYSAWAAKTAKVVGNEVVPTVSNGHYYRATVAGTTGPSQPTFPTAPGATVTDNAGLAGVPRSTALSVGQSFLRPGGTSTDVDWWEVTAIAGTATTAATAPVYPHPAAAGTTQVDGEVTLTSRKTVTWQEVGGIYIDTDEDGETINQLYLFVPPYYANQRFDIDNVARFAVMPGQAYSFAVRGRHIVPTDQAGSRPWFLTLYNPQTGEERNVGSPYGSGATGRVGWADRTVPSFTPKAGFTELRAHFRNMGPGLYLFQDVVLTRGASVVRGYGLTGAGWFRARLDSETPYRAASFRELTDGWARVDLVTDNPEGTSVTSTYQHSQDLATWTTFDPGAGLPDGVRYAAIRGDLASSADRRRTPYVPPEGAHLITRPALPLFLRGDRSELPGGATVDGLELPPNRPRFEVDEVGGHRHVTDITEAVMWTRPFVVEVYTEAAKRELEENWHEVWIIEDPYLFDGAGALLTVVFAEEVTLEEEDIPRSYVTETQGTVRKLWARAEVQAEVLDIRPLYA